LNAEFAQVWLEPISADQARPLRAVVLRPGYPFEKSIYPQDSLPQVLHAGALLEGELVGVATVFPEEPPWVSAPDAWRLRGMAVLAPVRGLGIGKQLIGFCLDHIRSQGGRMLWCNARVAALAFYQGLGFQTIGQEFLSPESGPHFQMFKLL
jgi:GNAT superfamily N-acetyltransferase